MIVFDTKNRVKQLPPKYRDGRQLSNLTIIEYLGRIPKSGDPGQTEPNYLCRCGCGALIEKPQSLLRRYKERYLSCEPCRIAYHKSICSNKKSFSAYEDGIVPKYTASNSWPVPQSVLDRTPNHCSE